MPLPIQNLYSYPNYEDLTGMFSPASLLNRIKIEQGIELTDTSSDVQINSAITRLVVPLDFGTTSSVSHEFLNGTTIRPNDNVYPASSIHTPIKGFKIGEPGTNPKPRAVIAAGVHGREVAPPFAVCRYLAQLIINYIRAEVFFDYKGPNLIHPAFSYQAGPRSAEDEAGNPLPGRADARLSPTATGGVFIDQLDFDFNDLTAIIQTLEIILLPVVNPDGRNFVLTQPHNTETPKEIVARVFWRKNRHGLLPHTGTNGSTVPMRKVPLVGNITMRPIGVDIDRNADIAWDPSFYYDSTAARANSGTGPGNTGTLTTSQAMAHFDDYSGPTSNSEPETQAVVNALTQSFNATGGVTGVRFPVC